MDLSAVDLVGADLRGANLGGVDLDGRDLSGADLSGADLRGALLSGANLSDSELRGARLDGARAPGARFDRSNALLASAEALVATDASFVGAEWVGSRLHGARLDGADARGARFDQASLPNASWTRGNLGRAVLDGADLDGADLAACRAAQVALLGARGRVSLRACDLRGADLRGVRLDELDLDAAQLDGARVDAPGTATTRVRLEALGWTPSRWSRLPGVAWGLVRDAAPLARQLALALGARLERWRQAQEVDDDAEDEVSPPASPGAGADAVPVDRVPDRAPPAVVEAPAPAAPAEEPAQDDPNFAWDAFARERARAEAASQRELQARLRAIAARPGARPRREPGMLPPALRPTRLARALVRAWREPDDADDTRARPASSEATDLFEEATADRTREQFLAAVDRDVAALRAARLLQARRLQLAAAEATTAARTLDERIQQAQRAHEAREQALAEAGAPTEPGGDEGATPHHDEYEAPPPPRPAAGGPAPEAATTGAVPGPTAPPASAPLTPRDDAPARTGAHLPAAPAAAAPPSPPEAGAPIPPAPASRPAPLGGLPGLLQDLDAWARAEEATAAPAPVESGSPSLRARSRAFFDELSERLPYGLQVLDGFVRTGSERFADLARRLLSSVAALADSGSRSTLALAARAVAVASRAALALAGRLATGAVRVLATGARLGARAARRAGRWAALGVVALGLTVAAGLRAAPRRLARGAAATSARAREGVVAGSRGTAKVLARGGRLGVREARRAAAGAWRWLVGDEQADLAPTLEESLDFAADASGREDAARRADDTRLLAARRRVRHRRARQFAQVARAQAAAAAREAATLDRAWTRHDRALVRARSARATEAARLERELALNRRSEEAAARRALADQTRRAQVAREATRRQENEAAVLAATQAELADVEARLGRLQAGTSSVEPGLVTALERRAAELNKALATQAQRLQEATEAVELAGRDTAGLRRRALVGAVRRGVDRLGAAGLGASTPTLEVGPGMDLSGATLDERDLAGADLRGARLVGAGLVGTDLRGADLGGADLTDADLTGARLDGARLDDAVLEGALLDHVDLGRVSITGVRARGARLGSTRGLDPSTRARLLAAGAVPMGQDHGGTRAVVVGLGIAAAIVGAVYVLGRVGTEGRLDLGALEQAATEAKQSGDAGAAVSAFEKLAAGAERSDSKVDYLLEGAASAEEGQDRARALELYDAAVDAAVEAADAVRARLSRAEAWARLDLHETAAAEFRALLQRSDLSPEQAARSIVGLARVLPADDQVGVAATQAARLAGAGTDPERGSLAYALADAWAAVDDGEAARSALRAALDVVSDPFVSRQIRVRLARAHAEDEQAEQALTIYRALMAEDGGDDARLGAAELLLRTGRDSEASTILAPLYTADDHDIQARALRARAMIAERAGDMPLALSSIRAILELDGVPAEVLDEARVVLARLDPSAVDELVADNPSLRSELLLGRAQALQARGERTDARAIWVEIAEDPGADPNARVDAMIALADLELEDNDADGAIRRFDELLAGTLTRDARDRVTLGRNNALLRGGRIQEAEAAYLALRGRGSEELAAQCDLGLARAAELRGQGARAAELYLKVGRTDGPWAMEALLALGELRERSGERQGAIEAYRLARSRPGDSSRKTAVDIRLASALDESGDTEAAAAIYANLLAADTPEVRVAARVAVASTLVGRDPQGARTLLDEALLEAVPGEDRNLARAAWVAASVAAGLVAEANTRLEAWLDTEGDAGAREQVAAAAMRAMREAGHAAAAADVGARYASAGFEAAMEAAISLREAGRPGEAATVLTALTGSTAEDERWRREMLADVLVDADRLDEADDVWASLDAGADPAARFGRARVARSKGDYATALRLLEGSTDPRAPEERGLAYEGMGRWDDAAAAYEALAKSSSAEMQTAGRVGQARVRLALDDPPGALAALAKLSVVDPGYALTVAQIKAESLLAVGRVDEARDVYAALDADAEQRTVRSLGLAECALASDDAKAALSWFDQAFRGTSDRFYQAHAVAGLARAWAELGNGEKAQAELARLRRDYADRPDALERATAVPGR